MKRAFRILAIVWTVFWLLGAIAMFSTKEMMIGLTFLILSGLGLIPIFKIKVEKKEQASKPAAVIKVKPKTIEEQLTDMDFNISKHLKLGMYNHFYVDDVNKKFAVIVGRKGQIKVYNYNDLGEFELNEDGNSIVKGKGLATVVGGLTFGLLGAMVGSSGKRKNENTCTSLIVRIMVNELQNPEIVIPLIVTEVKKSSIIYTNAISQAKALIATLNYIKRGQEQGR